MTNPYPIPRGVRQTDVLVGNGGRVYGPFDGLKVFDTEDVEVLVRPVDAEFFSTASVTVAKVSSEPFDYFTVEFPYDVPTTTRYQVRSVRLAERSAGVEKGTRIDMTGLEKELSKIATTQQELRRDVFPADPELADGDILMVKDGRMVPGPDLPALAAEAQAARDIAVAAAADLIAQGNVPIYSTVDALAVLEIPQGTTAFQTRGFHELGIGPGMFIDPVDADPARSDYVEVTVKPVSGPPVQRWYREAQETGRIDLARHGLFGDAATNNLRDETTTFLDAVEVMADRGLKGLTSPGGRGYKLIHGAVPADFDFDGGGSTLFADFSEHEPGNNYAFTMLSTQSADNRKIALRNVILNGQNNPGVVMQGGEPLLYFRGGETDLDRVTMTRGANRRYTGGVNTPPANKNDYENAEILIRNPTRVTVDRCIFRSSPGENLQIADDNRTAIVQVMRSYFTKKRDFNSGLWSSSGLNIFNALHVLLWGNIFEDFIKGPANIEAERAFAFFNVVRRVSDSSGLDFCEARTMRNNQIVCVGNHLEDIVSVGLRFSSSNVLLDGNSYNRVNIGASNEGGVVPGTGAGSWIKNNPAPLYNWIIRNQLYMDWNAAHANLIGVRALGASSTMPVHVELNGNDIYDRPDATNKKALYGFWGQHSELVAKGRHSLGRTAVIYQTGASRLHAIDAQFAPEAGESVHTVHLDSAIAAERSIVFDTVKRETVLDAGNFDIRTDGGTIDRKAIHVNNSPAFAATSNNAVAWRDGKLTGTANYTAGGTLADGSGFSLDVTVTGARLGDEPSALVNSGSVAGMNIGATVKQADILTVRVQNETGAVSATLPNPLPITAIVRPGP
ncbi:hypothetical protein KGO5_01751 [Sinorhizobium sp. KGO-5]|uniref:hypothetical protein n=1 Tax=Sinorhizobium sp. KGO-5 TaxID=1470810 RepID=UPI002949FBCA|nr:hypothetical protein KGO5_01751 [Sinorhizobium sp. KGO-5]